MSFRAAADIFRRVLASSCQRCTLARWLAFQDTRGKPPGVAAASLLAAVPFIYQQFHRDVRLRGTAADCQEQAPEAGSASSTGTRRAPHSIGSGGQRAAAGSSSSSSSKSRVRQVAEGRHFAVFSSPGILSQELANLASLDQLLRAVGGPEPKVLLIGEVHDDQVAHMLQLRILQHCAAACRSQGRRLVLSLEMFEGDVQEVLDEYVLHGAIREQDMLQDARPWGNYARDYRPLVEFCREQRVRVVAANAPRRYVSLVSRHGSSALQRLAPSGLPPMPMPPPSAAYREKFIGTIASQMPAPPNASAGQEDGSCPFIGFSGRDVREAKPQMLEAQQLWDHAMALSVAKALKQENGEEKPPLVVHICGAFHCAHGLGIPEALPLYTRPQHAESEQSENSVAMWLPIDEPDLALHCGREGAGLRLGAEGMESGPDEIGPKCLPPGVVSVVLWPAAVAATVEAARSGATPRSLAAMGNWVVITDEMWGEGVPA